MGLETWKSKRGQSEDVEVAKLKWRIRDGERHVRVNEGEIIFMGKQLIESVQYRGFVCCDQIANIFHV